MNQVEWLPGNKWLRVTLPDGSTRQLCLQFGTVARGFVSFPEDPPEVARPFAEAIVSALGGRVEGERWLTVVLYEADLPPMPRDLLRLFARTLDTWHGWVHELDHDQLLTLREAVSTQRHAARFLEPMIDDALFLLEEREGVV